MNDTYLETYPYLVSFCSSQLPFNKQSFLQASLMVYGWMPTSLKLKGNIDASVSAINALLKEERPTEDLLTTAHQSINNSIIGLSKLLHFSKPEVFPIWDSKIAERQFGMKHQYAYNKPIPYADYFVLVHKTISSDRIFEIRNFAEKNIPYHVSDVRAVEYYIFNGNKVT